MIRRSIIFAAVFAMLPAPAASAAQAPSVSPAAALHWRFVGPLRAGRTVAVTGVPQERSVFYLGAVNGGIWKTDDFGRTWNPIFEGEPTQSIGALAVAPNDANIIYAGSGEGLRRPDLAIGDGMWKSTDAGAAWTHIGLRDAQQIAAIAVDPTNANVVFVAALGHPYGPNAQRGLYRSTNGGTSWQRVLGPNDDDTGAVDVVIDPNHPQVVYADLWSSRNAPWHFMDILQQWRGDGLYKSTDGGTTWTQLTHDLPANLGRVGIAVAPSDSQRLYAWVNTATTCGIYRSGDAGASWQMTNDEHRVCGRGDDFAGVTVAPRNPDVVWVANTSTYRSTDGGRHFIAYKGAPGGDDYHTVWIDPRHPTDVILGSDQGATISVNGGRTWSSWYNQPTAQMYNVTADDRFPYWVCGGQQDSGTACVRSRGDDGAITVREWHPVGGEEYGYVAPDPLHPGIFFAGKATRFDERTSEVRDIAPFRFPSKRYRFDRTAPLVFNHVDKRTLYLGANVIFATTDGGKHWHVISPDLTRKAPGVPKTLRGYVPTNLAANAHRGVVYALGPSYVDARTLWAGTDDGLVWLTHNGGATWKNVTPPELTPWSKVSQIDASRFDAESAYLAVTRFRLNDLHPYIYVTHDDGQHWRLAVNGLPLSPINAVRQDPVRRDLLYAASENGVSYSLDDGANWHSLQRNLPSSSARDIVVHGDDLIVATHGRGFWILTDLEPLREWKPAIAQKRAFLFAPQVAYRVRRDLDADTPLPPEEPRGQNPPDGAILDYYLGAPAKRVTLQIYDAKGHLVRSMASDAAAPPPLLGLNVPTWWEKPTVWPGLAAGMHRFLWDLRRAAPLCLHPDLPISAIPHETPRIARGVLVPPGRYTVRLVVDSVSKTAPLLLLPDPREHTGMQGYRQQYRLARALAATMNQLVPRYQNALTANQTATLRRLGALEERVEDLYGAVEESDSAPTSQIVALARRLLNDYRRFIHA